MGLKKTLKRISKAIPVIIANAPALADAVRQVKEALQKPKAPQPAPATRAVPPAGPAPAE
jgi:hypothetical protein